MITIEQAEKAAIKMSKLPCYNPHVMVAGVSCEDKNFCVKVYLFQRLDIDTLPKDIDGVKVYYQHTGKFRAVR